MDFYAPKKASSCYKKDEVIRMYTKIHAGIKYRKPIISGRYDTWVERTRPTNVPVRETGKRRDHDQ